jgi:hypothetical protein
MNNEMNQAIVESLRSAKVETDSAEVGKGFVPFSFASGAEPSFPDDPIRYCDIESRPPMESVRAAYAEASGANKNIPRLVVAWDVSGRVLRSQAEDDGGDTRLREALQAWGLTLQMKPGRAGEGYLDFYDVKKEFDALR